MFQLNFNESNLSVTMRYDELVALMNDCVRTTIKMVRAEDKAKENKIWYSTAEAAKKVVWAHPRLIDGSTMGIYLLTLLAAEIIIVRRILKRF